MYNDITFEEIAENAFIFYQKRMFDSELGVYHYKFKDLSKGTQKAWYDMINDVILTVDISNILEEKE